MTDLHIVIMAAGMGTRMKSQIAKVLHGVAGRPMIDYVLRTAASLQPASIIVIVGHMAEDVRRSLADWRGIDFVLQEPQLGTGHAVLQAEPLLKGRRGTLLLLSGDVPLLRAATLRQLRDAHERAGAGATIVTAVMDDASGYGRILREGGQIAGIVEDRDASPAEREIREINSGIYAFELEPLFDAIRGIGTSNVQREYYLPDLVAIYRSQGRKVVTLVVDQNEIRGINSRRELAEVTRIVRQAKNDALMAAGVTLEDPSTAYIDDEVEIGPDTIIRPNVTIEGKTTIGAGCEIQSGVRITDSALGDGIFVNNCCVIVGSRVASGARIGPFAHLRPQSDVGAGAHIGNFVELKKTVLGAGSKANHLTYLGDATVGERVNVGAGTITCNYDGTRKHETVIEDGAFIGSDSQLIAPVKVGKGAYVAAGSSITDDVPAGSLGIARGRQVNVEGWVEKKKKV